MTTLDINPDCSFAILQPLKVSSAEVRHPDKQASCRRSGTLSRPTAEPGTHAAGKYSRPTAARKEKYGIETARPDEAGACIATLALGFANDPGVRWMYPDPLQYQENFPRFASAFGGRAFDHGTAHNADGNRAAALWLAPGVEPDEAALVALIERSVSERERESVFAMFEALGRHHPHEPHWYLPLMAADPTCQGRGLGSALLHHGLAVCDAQRLPVYLEATSPRSIPLYARHGFEALGVVQIGSSPPIVPMLRKPRQAREHCNDATTGC
jgi:GNAT superfamily N-acetyltransferase